MTLESSLGRRSERLPVWKINDAKNMPAAWSSVMQEVLDADDIRARIRAVVRKVSDNVAGVV
jgi:hypothetical protein